MKVFFGTTTLHWRDYRDYYFSIRDYLKEIGCVILQDWIDEADRFYGTPYKDRNIAKIFKTIVNAINETNVVVIEYTVPNFSSSHQINYALLKKKPTLVMRLTKDNPRFSDSYLEAIQSPHLTLRDYTKENYKEVIDDFLGIVEIGLGNQRYNIVLEKKQKYYLDWASNYYKKSRSEMIRELIDGKSDKDKNYRRYLK
ncbi:MAG: hypothetical protein UT24_C0010G0005 [Candidatus Woesebacteria bacterium GW2011_GWB1_39_12]|uniref:Nucleoside 2-deoxyribosyltransferase n=2 Tax=Candidatus Woeseibacteriota TaxID=1752722 RepID=A0A0G0Q897_9BACT|nr:MAG: hypothetical protein UT23_C0007G0054 [Candidatus Woesebacteria bacterium GW2011_GWA1_39_12]KKR00632.1 MAG: hypothetical protein UT24_C0010G0005 [Candidatus Woesebacteria bacterium GW2011_GWB1_39_12]